MFLNFTFLQYKLLNFFNKNSSPLLRRRISNQLRIQNRYFFSLHNIRKSSSLISIIILNFTTLKHNLISTFSFYIHSSPIILCRILLNNRIPNLYIPTIVNLNSSSLFFYTISFKNHFIQNSIIRIKAVKPSSTLR